MVFKRFTKQVGTFIGTDFGCVGLFIVNNSDADVRNGYAVLVAFSLNIFKAWKWFLSDSG